jgi:hypothetical protein
LLSCLLQIDRCCSSYWGMKKHTGSNKSRANQRPPDGISINPRTKRPFAGVSTVRRTFSRQSTLQSPTRSEMGSYGSAKSRSKRCKTGQSPVPHTSSLLKHSLVQDITVSLLHLPRCTVKCFTYSL